MKRIVSFSVILIVYINCFSQELELCTSLGTSTSDRFKNAKGIGLQYQQNISKRFIVGLGTHYNYDNTHSENFQYDLNTSNEYSETSKVHRISIRLNIQGLMIDRKYISLSFGPELSYNYIWGRDYGLVNYPPSNVWTNYTENINAGKYIGLGVISSLEIKRIFIPKLSLCFNIRPEFITNGEFSKVDHPDMNGLVGFMEYQIGLRYKINNSY